MISLHMSLSILFAVSSGVSFLSMSSAYRRLNVAGEILWLLELKNFESARSSSPVEPSKEILESRKSPPSFFWFSSFEPNFSLSSRKLLTAVTKEG